MKSDLMDAVDAVRLSKATIRNIKENLFWAFFYNIICIPLAAGAFYPLLGLRLSPMVGAAAMSLSSVCVVSNALRRRFGKRKAHLVRRFIFWIDLVAIHHIAKLINFRQISKTTRSALCRVRSVWFC